MRVREGAAVAVALLAALWSRLPAQATRDRPTLVLTVSGAYLDDVGLWTVADQPIDIDAGEDDHFFLGRNIKRTLGAGFSGTYFKGQHFGLNVETFLVGLGYQDVCRMVGPVHSADNVQRCSFIDGRDRSAAAVAASVGGIYRFGPQEFISPFLRGSVGVLINNQSPLLTTGETANGALLTIYDDKNRGTRLRPAFGLGAGATIAMSSAYHIRFEVRDNVLGVQEVTGPVSVIGSVPPHKTVYKHIFSLMIGLDVVLERVRGRRY
jgi:hypothetical protein